MTYDPITISIVLFFLLVFLVLLASFASICYLRRIDLGPIFHKIATLKGDVASLQNTKSDLSAELKSLKNEVAVAEQTIARAKAEQDWLDQNRDTIAQMRNQIAIIRTELNGITNEKNKLNGELQEKRQELQSLAGEIASLHTKQTQYTSDVLARQRQITGLENEKKSLEILKATVEKENDQAKQQLLQTQNMIIQKENELRLKEQALSDALSRLERIERECENKTRERDELKEEIKRLRENIATLTGTLHGIEVDIAAKGPAEEGEKWHDLDTQLTGYPLDGIQSRNLESEEDWLNKFEDNLRKNGIKFDKRTIRAFHTGLKVADYSPLVVLAGISGTGKSLLPRLYSEAIGMNFLQIAVQPRWDNPQDMFGFYNYMEGRYKATELSRMLWQYDVYNNKNAEEKLDGIIPMNLVLLDEMNIAKVEYYFSDMLSKLEVRRDINENNPESRLKAEIEIECGSIREGSKPRRLFVGRNTLFVGTMNEDESTQSLSDKVIDRSNLLRFGKPKDISVNPKVESFDRIYNDSAVLAYDNWKQWIRMGQLSESQVEILKSINEQLEKMERPFAYRVANAIQAYIINYPDQSPFGKQTAMADQIEMKILPKLNGIDKDSVNNKRALDEIGNIIDTIGDDALSTAFKSAKDDSDHVFFQWRGIAR
jgi:septal ring factor EnvC (AmiA/AmiB activator)